MKKLKTILILLSFLAGAAVPACAQTNEAFSISFKDSASADQATTFLYGTMHLKNLTAAPLRITVSAISPKGWKMVSEESADLTLTGGGSSPLPFTIAKKQNAPAGWQVLKIIVKSAEYTDTVRFHINAEELSNFSVAAGEAAFTRTPGMIAASFMVRNSGNIPGNYFIRLTDERTGLSITSRLKLDAGRDSIYRVDYKIPKALLYNFSASKIRLEVNDLDYVKKEKTERSRPVLQASSGNNNPYITNLDLVREDSSFSKNSSPYSLIKTDVETGYLRNNSSSSYFYALRGELPLSLSSSIAVSYRSRQYGVYNLIDRNVADVIYRNNRLFIHAGKITDAKYFYSYGNGLSIGYSWNADSRITAFGVIHTPGFFAPNDNYGLTYTHRAGSVLFTHDAVYNNDIFAKQKSYLLNNEVRFRKFPSTEICINYGVAMTTPGINQPEKNLGQSYGYVASFRKKKVSVASQLRIFDKNYPGLNKNHQSGNLNLKYSIKKNSVEAFFHYDYRVSNYFIDTLYNTSILKNNIKQYGIRYNIIAGRSSLVIGAGLISQAGNSETFLGPQYRSAELQYYYKAKKDFIISMNSTTAFANIADKTAIFSISNFNARYKFAGINGGFSNVPVFLHSELLNKRILYDNQQTIYGGPYFSILLFKKLSVGSQYSFSKTLYDKSINTFMSYNLSYNDAATGWQIAVNGYQPLQSPSQGSASPIKNGYLNLSVRKRLYIPFAAKRKYYDIKARLFEDDNSNNVQDKGEKSIAGAKLNINDLKMITDRNGTVHYKNVDRGSYALNLDRDNIYGYLPAHAVPAAVAVKRRNVTIEIPFRKSSTISGLITILHDTANAINYYPQNVKVIVTDSSGSVFYTTTNKDGRFYFTLPASVYRIELSPESVNEMWRLKEKSFTADLNKVSSYDCNFVISQRRREMKIMKVKEEVVVQKTEEPKDNNSKKTTDKTAP